jgi:NADPH:quinone reductase-like Zn-dependent oxidoreductase
LRWRSSLIRGAGGCSRQTSHGTNPGRECRITPLLSGRASFGIGLQAVAEARRTLSVCRRVDGHPPSGSADRPFAGRAAGKKIRLLAVRLGAQHLAPIVELCQAAKIATVIDGRYRLSEVTEALRHRGEGHAEGKVVVIVE